MSGRAGESTTGTLVLGALFGLFAATAGYLLTRPLPARSLPERSLSGTDGAGPPHTEPSESMRLHPSASGPHVEARAAARLLYGGAAALATSVLADSAMEHYRGGFYNKVMFVAPTVAGLALVTSAWHLASDEAVPAGKAIYGAAAVTGLVGAGFHAWNITRRVGGWRWLNLFYGAPLAAPLGHTFAGLFGLAAERLRTLPPDPFSGRTPGRLLALASAAGLFGTAGEAGLLHFRGAFQDPFMFLPVTLPPLAGAALLGATLNSRSRLVGVARALLGANRLLGFAGVGFHAFGIQRNMGGWRNWSQMLQQGPPLPAPPSFTGMALAGEAALRLQFAATGRSLSKAVSRSGFETRHRPARNDERFERASRGGDGPANRSRS